MAENTPIASVVRTAATPAQAKLYAALLQAEGIPAHVDGDTLADEIAVSRSVMNLGNVRVLVPTSSLARAKEILAATAVDEDELEAQALAAAEPETPARTRTTPRSARGSWFPVAAVAVVVAFVFLSLWRGEVEARQLQSTGKVRYEPIENGLREIRVRDGVVLANYFDRDRDGHYEELVQLSSVEGQSVATDADGDARFESLVEHRGALVYRWSDLDLDGAMDECTVVDAATGEVRQRLRYVAGTGFVVE